MTVALEFPLLIEEIKKQVFEYNQSSDHDIFIETDLPDEQACHLYIRFNNLTWVMSHDPRRAIDRFTLDVFQGHQLKPIGIGYQKEQEGVLHSTHFTGTRKANFMWLNLHPEYEVRHITSEELAHRLIAKIIITKFFRTN